MTQFHKNQCLKFADWRTLYRQLLQQWQNIATERVFTKLRKAEIGLADSKH